MFMCFWEAMGPPVISVKWWYRRQRQYQKEERQRVRENHPNHRHAVYTTSGEYAFHVFVQKEPHPLYLLQPQPRPPLISPPRGGTQTGHTLIKDIEYFYYLLFYSPHSCCIRTVLGASPVFVLHLSSLLLIPSLVLTKTIRRHCSVPLPAGS